MKRTGKLGVALVGALVAVGVLSPGAAEAAIDGGSLVTCIQSPSDQDIGDLKVVPGLTTQQKKQTLIGTMAVSNCYVSEGTLDEIAMTSKFGVTKTNRPLIAKGSAKLKLTAYDDCLGWGADWGASEDRWGEYKAHGTVTMTWMSSGGAKVASTTAFVRVDAGPWMDTRGIVTKGLGIGADWTQQYVLTGGAADDGNGNGTTDLDDCKGGDPTALARALDIRTYARVGIEFPLIWGP